jgi:hypothetical protein
VSTASNSPFFFWAVLFSASSFIIASHHRSCSCLTRMSARMPPPGTPRASQPRDHAAALIPFKYLAACVQQYHFYFVVPFQLAHDASINRSITPAG